MNISNRMLDKQNRRVISIIMLISILLSVIVPTKTSTVYADDGDLGVGSVVHLEIHHTIRYGTGDGGYSNLMQATGIDDSLGSRYVFCTQPYMPTPPDGNYKIDKMYTEDTGKASVLRKLIYYAKGYPGLVLSRTVYTFTSKYLDYAASVIWGVSQSLCKPSN